MRELKLFLSAAGEWITNNALFESLCDLGALDHDILYVHTDISFGTPNPEMHRQELLGALAEVLFELRAKTLLLPSFTFSFCNGEDYSVNSTRSKMGVLNEYFRKLPQATRSVDPLMSTVLLGEKRHLVDSIGKKSVGEGCTFDLLHREKDVQFLFFGVHPAKCFTYSHYVEDQLRVPYRYDRAFTGRIIDANGREYMDTYELFVRYKDVVPTSDNEFERDTVARSFMRQVQCGDGSLSLIDEITAFDVYKQKITQDINYMLSQPCPARLIEEFHAENMVAL